MQSGNDNVNLQTEKEIEDEVNAYTGLLKNFKIAKCERTRFALFGIMFGIIGFIYSFMRILKDNFVMTRQDPICILYIKLVYITPLSFIVVLGINYLLAKRSISKLFSLFSFVFISLFVMCGFIVMIENKVPMSSASIEERLASYSLDTRGLGFFKYILMTISEPLATFVYILAEMWGSLILSYLFLSYMNEMCYEKQHKRFIPPLFIIANVSLFLSALVTTGFYKIQENLTHEQNAIFMGAIFFLEAILVLGMLFCKYILETKVITVPMIIPPKAKKTKGPKLSSSFKESLKMMMKSKFLLIMCLLICFYSIAYNILETVFKNGIKKGADMMGIDRGRYSGKFNSYDQYLTSISVIFLNLSSFSTAVDSKGWKMVALITPVTAIISAVCILGLGSYNSATEEGSIGILNSLFGGRKAFYTAENYLGIICLSALKIFKFTAFDVTKERISMRIDSKQRAKFKSIYDGIFNKFGKSMGAIYGIILIILVTDIDFRGMSPLTGLILGSILIFWLYCVTYLSGSYNTSTKTGEPIDIDIMNLDDTDEEQEEQAENQNEKLQENTEAVKTQKTREIKS